MDAAEELFGPVFSERKARIWVDEIRMWIGLDVGKADHHATVMRW